MDNSVDPNLSDLANALKKCVDTAQNMNLKEVAKVRHNRYVIRMITRMLHSIILNLKYTDNLSY